MDNSLNEAIIFKKKRKRREKIGEEGGNPFFYVPALASAMVAI